MWHLTNATDSSASGYNLTASASAPTSTAGLIGSATTGAYDFEASTKQYFTNTSTPNLGITTAETVSLWFKPEGGGVNNELFGLWSSNGYTNGLRDIITNDTGGDVWKIRQTGTSGYQSSDAASVALTHGNTFYVVGSWDPANLKFYRYTNGGNYDEDTMASTTKAFTGNVITWVGFNNTDSIDGIVDEIRVQGRILSSDWIATEYNNQSAPATFITEGTEEDVGNTSVTITPDALALTSVIPEFTVTLPKNITVVTTVQSLTSSQPNCTVYPPTTTTANNVIYMANRDRIAIKLNDSGTVYLELD